MGIKKIVAPLLVSLVLSCFTLTGCEDVQIFEQKVDDSIAKPLKDTELENGKYYVKNNTRFFEVYMPKGNASNSIATLNEKRVMATLDDDKKIPTHYNDEFIAFQSDSIEFSNVELERFKDLGYSFGCYNGTLTKDGYLYINTQECVIEDSSFYKAIEEKTSTEIRIASIDGKLLTKENLNTRTGVIVGLEKDKSYKVGYYAGTKYFEENIVADTKIYAAYELFSYGPDYIKDTPNGYMSFNTPSELKSGYYNINGKGLFRYYNFARGTQEEAYVNMNESYYKDEKTRIEAYSRQYSVNVPQRVKDFKINIEYNLTDDLNSEDTIQGIVFAPDGTQMDMDIEGNTISIALAEAMAGDWTVNVIPKTLSINKVDVQSDKAVQETTCEETLFVLPENRENIEFIAEYTFIGQPSPEKIKDMTIFGNILTDDGRTYEMKQLEEKVGEETKYYLGYELPFAEAGNYVMKIYHYPNETKINEPIIRDKVSTDTEVFVIEG